MRPFKLNRTPKLTEGQREHRLRFAKDHKDWSAEDWRKVLWSEESSFEFHNSPNHHNCRIRAVSSSKMDYRDVVSFGIDVTQELTWVWPSTQTGEIQDTDGMTLLGNNCSPLVSGTYDCRDICFSKASWVEQGWTAHVMG